jgi:serine O-acetyltransferase
MRWREPRKREEPRFVAYGTPTGDLPDPATRAIEGLLDEVQSLRARVNSLEARAAGDAIEVDDGPAERGVEDETRGAADAPHGKC